MTSITPKDEFTIINTFNTLFFNSNKKEEEPICKNLIVANANQTEQNVAVMEFLTSVLLKVQVTTSKIVFETSAKKEEFFDSFSAFFSSSPSYLEKEKTHKFVCYPDKNSFCLMFPNGICNYLLLAVKNTRSSIFLKGSHCIVLACETNIDYYFNKARKQKYCHVFALCSAIPAEYFSDDLPLSSIVAGDIQLLNFDAKCAQEPVAPIDKRTCIEFDEQSLFEYESEFLKLQSLFYQCIVDANFVPVFHVCLNDNDDAVTLTFFLSDGGSITKKIQNIDIVTQLVQSVEGLKDWTRYSKNCSHHHHHECSRHLTRLCRFCRNHTTDYLCWFY